MDTDEEIAQRVIETFTRVTAKVNDRHLTDLRPESSIDELGVGSAVLVEIISEIEMDLEVEFPNSELGKIRTIGDLTTLAQSLRRR